MIAIIVGVLLLLSGIVLFGLAVQFYRRTVNFRRTAIKAQATVVDFHAELGPAGGNDETFHYFPIFMFEDTHGKAHKVRSDIGTRVPPYEVGSIIPILYDSQNPTDARIDSFTTMWLLAVGCAGLGVTTIAIGLIFLVLRPE
jgi:hypothetical protein